MNNNKLNKIIGVVFLLSISIATASSPTSFNITKYLFELPHSNNSVTINVTSQYNNTNITFVYNNVYYPNGTSLNQTWFNGLLSINTTNQTSALVNFTYAIPVVNTTGLYYGSISLNKTNESQENISFYFNITANPSWGNFSYSGNCTLLNAVAIPQINITKYLNQTPFNQTNCFAINMPQDSYLGLFTTSWVYSETFELNYTNTSTMEFNVTLAVPQINSTSPSVQYLQNVILVGSTSKIITYQINLFNQSIIATIQNTTSSTNTTNSTNTTIINSTTTNSTYIPPPLNYSMTIAEFLQMIRNYNDTLPKYIVQVVNDTEYVNVPTNSEAFVQWLNKYNPREIEVKDSKIKELETAQSTLQSDKDFLKKNADSLQSEKQSLSNQLIAKDNSYNASITALNKKYEEEKQMWINIGIGIVISSILVWLGLWYRGRMGEFIT